MSALDPPFLVVDDAPASQPWRELFRGRMLSAGSYRLPAGSHDGQRPHAQDELYYVAAGAATLVTPHGSAPVRAGSVAFVRARVPHRFENITSDLVAFVVFAPPEHEGGTAMPNYEGRRFRAVSNSASADVGSETVFEYHQQGTTVWGTYAGGQVRFGTLVATMDEGGGLHMRYQHVTAAGMLRTGRCLSRLEILADGRYRLHETWEWTEPALGSGTSVIDEIG